MILKYKIELIFAAFALAVLAYFTTPYWSHESQDVVITAAFVKPYDNTSKYLVFTDAGVFENTDTWYYFKFDSSDVQSKLMQPGKYRISYYGFRVPFFSRYPNIISSQRIQ